MQEQIPSSTSQSIAKTRRNAHLTAEANKHTAPNLTTEASAYPPAYRIDFLPGYTGLRAIAAFMVIIAHVTFWTGWG